VPDAQLVICSATGSGGRRNARSSAAGVEALTEVGVEALAGVGEEASSAFGEEASFAVGVEALTGVGEEASSAVGVEALTAVGVEALTEVGVEALTEVGVEASTEVGVEASTAFNSEKTATNCDSQNTVPMACTKFGELNFCVASNGVTGDKSTLPSLTLGSGRDTCPRKTLS